MRADYDSADRTIFSRTSARELVVIVVVRMCFCGGGQNRRNQIREALPHPRAGFNDQMLPLGNCRGHGLGHFQLLWPLFVVIQPRCNPACRSENLASCEHAYTIPESFGARVAVADDFAARFYDCFPSNERLCYPASRHFRLPIQSGPAALRIFYPQSVEVCYAD